MNKPLIVETGPNPTAAVIWLHGLGASGHDFEPIVPHLNLPADMAVRFVFPHAPSRAVTINGGYIMPAWYDILAMDFERKIDEKQIQESSDAIAALINEQIAGGIDSRRIVIMGFSQGGAVAYQCALHFPKPLAGVMGLSTYFATHATVDPNPANAAIPVAIFHGNHDEVVPEAMGIAARRQLSAKGLSPSYQNYPMAHEVCLEEIQDISKQLQQWLVACPH